MTTTNASTLARILHATTPGPRRVLFTLAATCLMVASALAMTHEGWHSLVLSASSTLAGIAAHLIRE